jgi:autotransporter-associated beta strand protein
MNGTTAGTKTFEIGGANLDTTYAGRISNVYDNGAGGTDVVALTKVGTGTLTLTGGLTYTGDTKVNAGTLTIAGPGILNTPTANVSVATGATLNASSIVCDTLTIGGAPSVAAAVPEPSTMAMLVLAAIGLIGWAIRRFR